jgi:hypothetical protein
MQINVTTIFNGINPLITKNIESSKNAFFVAWSFWKWFAEEKNPKMAIQKHKPITINCVYNLYKLLWAFIHVLQALNIATRTTSYKCC